MSYELHKDGVITGAVNCYCLACNYLIEDQQEAVEHIKTYSHRVNLTLYPYLDKFKDQNIRKFDAGYFCEFCNVLLATTIQIGLHISEGSHEQNRGSILLKSLDHVIIANNSVVIKEDAWHGLMENTCVLCDTEFDGENEHKMDKTHILRLIQKPVKFRAGDAIYRQIDEANIQCLTCNLLFNSTTISQHFDSADHLNIYTRSKIEVADHIKKLKTQDVNPNNAVPSSSEAQAQGVIKGKLDGDEAVNIIADTFEQSASDNYVKRSSKHIYSNTKTDCSQRYTELTNKPNNEEIKHELVHDLHSMEVYLKHSIDINFESDIAFCRKCCVSIKLVIDDIDKHIEEHSKTERVKSVNRYPQDADKSKYFKQLEVNQVSDSDNNLKSKNIKSLPEIPNQNICLDDDKINIDVNEKADVGESSSNNASHFAKDNNITYNENNHKAFCRVCEVRLPSSFKSMQEHVEGVPHIRKVAESKAKNLKNQALKKVKMDTFINSIRRINNMYYPDIVVVINMEYYINELSFYLMQKDTTCSLWCLLCQRNIGCVPPFIKTHVRKHIKENHTEEMRNVPVITSAKSEFIREIRPEAYHCGYCNIVEMGWSKMKGHLSCSSHREKKALLQAIDGMARDGEIPFFFSL